MKRLPPSVDFVLNKKGDQKPQDFKSEVEKILSEEFNAEHLMAISSPIGGLGLYVIYQIPDHGGILSSYGDERSFVANDIDLVVRCFGTYIGMDEETRNGIKKTFSDRGYWGKI